jgi:Mrp family chromosome partitioning ATPase
MHTMAADPSASSQRRSYADQYLGSGARPNDPQTDPYGHWYAERLRRSGGIGDSAPYRAQRTPPASDPTVQEAAGETAAVEEPAVPLGTAAGAAGPGDGEPTDPDIEPAARGRAPGPDSMPGPAPEALAPAATLAPAVVRQLEQNHNQLSLVEGNLVAAAKSEVSTIYLTSCFQGEGKTTAALSTVYGLCAVSQARVLLIDGGNQAARLHSMLGISAYPGFNEVIEGRVELSHALHPTAGLPGLHVLACGAVDHAIMSEARRVDRIRSFLARVKPHYDFVVVDGGAALTSSDPARLAGCFDGLVFVVACERTKWEVVQGAVEKIRSGGGQVLGGVLNRRRFYIPQLIYRWISR